MCDGVCVDTDCIVSHMSLFAPYTTQRGALCFMYLTLLIFPYAGKKSSNYEPGKVHWFDSPLEISHWQIISFLLQGSTSLRS